MKYENIKSIILTILVVTSVVLTWNLWTYQPNYATMEKPNYIQEVALSEKREMGELIKPVKLLYHLKDTHLGTINSGDLEHSLEEMKAWDFYGFKNISDQIGNLPDFVQEKGNLEIIFPDTVPIELYKNMLNISDKKIPKFKFNRIVIDLESRKKDEGSVYFVNYGNPKYHQVYASHIKSADLNNFYNQFYSDSNQLTPYFPYKTSEERTIFLPENKTNITSYKYFLDRLDPEKFKDALFNDPSYVQRNDVLSNIEYTDGSSMLTVNNDTLMLSYVNPTEETDIMANSKDILQKSMDFVNTHGGWAGTYKYESIDELNQKIIYRLYDNKGYPIFSDTGMSEIDQVWGQQEIKKYTRPIFALDVPLRTETIEMTLITGKEVVELLKAKRGFKPELLEDLVVGYSMTKDPKEPQLINLEPSWFYKYSHSWVRITPKELGGIKNGLE
ncbi:YycH family regulatory protein [Bacillus sp. 1NLA3E]|uniref:YycH family regulatory protein n=1 Tax=Bacillus sp. 1NLA3E TaxID=666686 RepID=UPI000247EE17|nr:two-component system activity regulator YycH [Bacillus sp. 1NLA3E]AGK56167.1 hypothetical protein B1NLA3E_22145 [Bacillus sp. 1NLA3E]